MSKNNLTIALPGAAGKMGQMIASLVAEDSDVAIIAASEHPQSPAIGQSIDTTTIISDATALGIGAGGVIIDFTRPEASMRHIDIALASGTAMVIGTTGLSAEQEEVLKKAATQIPIVYCANTSVGVTLLGQIVEQVARQLDADWDIEIVETHHNQKVDAPSGTALALGKAAAKGRQIDLDAEKESGRDGLTGARKSGAIGFAAFARRRCSRRAYRYLFRPAGAYRDYPPCYQPDNFCPRRVTGSKICGSPKAWPLFYG